MIRRMAEITVYHTEDVNEGGYGQWPLQSDYEQPTKPGYDFEGWMLGENIITPQQYSPTVFGPITEDTDIKAKWVKYNVFADANHRQIDSTGDTASNPTKLYYWAEKEDGTKITNGVNLVALPLSQGMEPIQFENEGTATIDGGKNVLTRKVLENTTNMERYYKFRAEYKPSLTTFISEDVTIKQVPFGVIPLGNFRHMAFTYTWGDNDGTDLDSATVLNAKLKVGNNSVDASKLYVGWEGGNYVTVAGSDIKFIEWGGDNQHSGDEGAYINFQEVCKYLENTVDEITIDIYANWFVEKRDGKMSLSFKLYDGETPLKHEGYVFKPVSETSNPLVKDLTVNNIIVRGYSHANCSPNTDPIVLKIKDNTYTHIAQVVYNTQEGDAVLHVDSLGTSSAPINGRDIHVSSEITIYNSQSEQIEKLVFEKFEKTSLSGSAFSKDVYVDKNLTGGTIVFSKFKEIINGETKNLELTSEKLGIFEKGEYEGTQYLNPVFENGDLKIGFTCTENTSTTLFKTIAEVRIAVKDGYDMFPQSNSVIYRVRLYQKFM